MKEVFYSALDRLVADARRYRTTGFGTVDPEEATKFNLIEPLLVSLGYSRDDIKKEFHILGDQVDYLLQQHNRPLLFMEAKSLLDSSANLFNAHKQQVFRYIRNYRVSPEQTRMERPVTWIVLTNFREFHFIRVNEEEPSFSFKLDELIPRRDELWELLALENVEAQRIEELYDQTHKADLDKRFLADLKRWRLIIANGFALQNPGVSLPDLTKASQQLLDRFLFCRMLETDRLIEYNKLARQFMAYEVFYGERPTKPFCEALKESLFAEIKRDFNTELFLRPQLCDQFAIDNAYLSIVIGHEPMSPGVAAQCGLDQGQGDLFPFKHLYGYDFSRMSGDIMGAVYERFLAHKLSTAAGRVSIEETNELRKKEGIYYTPRYIVDYIIAHTVSEKIKPILGEAKALLAYMNFKGAHAKIRELQHIKVLDAAMGSGSFLLRAFDTFVAAYAGYNAECDRITRERGQNSGMLFDAPADLPEAVDHIGMHVASENIFGVDLDDSAVEVAKLNIWMRLMIAEKDFIRETLRTRRNGAKALSLLPTLANNLKRGNSLIDDPAVAGDAVFNWQQQFPDIMARGGFDCVIGNPPYIFTRDQGFTEEEKDFFYKRYHNQSSQLNSFALFIERGHELIVPSGSLGFITPNNWLTIDTFAPLRKFLVESVCDLSLINNLDRVFADADVDTALVLFKKGHPTRLVAGEMLGEQITFIQDVSLSLVKPPAFIIQIGLLKDSRSQAMLEKIESRSKPLSDFCKVSTGLKAYQTGKGKPSQTDEHKQRRVFHATSKVNATYGKYLDGVDVGRYTLNWSGEYLSYGDWLAEPRKSVPFSGERLLVRQIPSAPPRMINGVFTAEKFYNDINSMVLFSSQEGVSLKYLLGLLNSRLVSFWFQKTFDKLQRKIFPQFKVAELASFPILPVDVSKSGGREKHSKVVALVDEMLEASENSRRFAPLLSKEIAHRQREACPLSFYLQPDYTTAVRGETLIDDVQREGFVHGIRVESDRNAITLTADVSDDADSAPRGMPIARLTFADETLQRFIYAMWQRFLEENARKKKWTAGKKPKPVYDLIVHELTPLVFFQQTPADNLREIRAVAKAVSDEAGTFDLVALETEIAKTDAEIDELVYELYGLTAEERQMVESASRR